MDPCNGIRRSNKREKYLVERKKYIEDENCLSENDINAKQREKKKKKIKTHEHTVCFPLVSF